MGFGPHLCRYRLTGPGEPSEDGEIMRWHCPTNTGFESRALADLEFIEKCIYTRGI